MKRRISFVAIGLAIILVPTYIMLSFYFSHKDIPVEIRNTLRVTMRCPDGSTIRAERDKDNAELLTMLCDMTLDSKSVEKRAEEGQHRYDVTFHSEHSQVTYRFYFGENPAYCYYEEDNQTVKRIATEKAELFLNSRYSEEVYAYAKAPTVSVDHNMLAATSLDWQYRRLDGSYQKASCSYAEKDIAAFDLGVIAGKLPITFEPTPDLVQLQVIDDKHTLVYTGDPDGFAAYRVSEKTNLQISMTVEWTKEGAGNAPFAGKATYNMEARMLPPGEFFISHTEVEAGQVFVLSGINVADPSSITVQISPVVNCVPKFIKKGEEMVALVSLGWPAGYASDSDYEITVNAPELPTPQTFTITVKGNRYPDFIDYVKEDVIRETYTLKIRNEFFDLVAEITSGDSVYVPENEVVTFTQAVSNPDGTRKYAYGTNVTVFNDDKKTYRALDTMYGIYSASKPHAVADGVVAYVGEHPLTGKLLVLDHGNGIRSWYCNLKEISVNVGDVVKMSDVIGKCGGGGFNGQAGINMHVALTLHQTALNLEIAIRDGIINIQK